MFNKKDRLYWALKIAATGNIIDSAIYQDIDVERLVEKEINLLKAKCPIVADSMGVCVGDYVLKSNKHTEGFEADGSN